jgi:hypothetical protein
MSTATSSSADQARLRRERREKKILAQGNSRLEKIAGLQGGAPAREAIGLDKFERPSTDYPDPPEHDIADTSGLQTIGRHGHALSPGRNLFGVDGGDEDPFNMLRGGNDPFANMPEELKNDPMMKLFMNNPMFGAGMQSTGAGVGGPDPDMDSANLNSLAEKLSKQLMGGLPMGQQDQQTMVPDSSAWKWKFVRIVSILTVLGYVWSQSEDYHFARNTVVTNSLVAPFYLIDLADILYLYRLFSLVAVSSDYSRSRSTAPWILDRKYWIISPPSVWCGTG